MTTPRPPASEDATLPESFKTFLGAPRYASIATLDGDGSPHLAFVWYLLDGDDLIVNSRTERHWPNNLLRDPRIHFGVREGGDRPYHWLGVKGRAEVLREGDAAIQDIMAMARRYGGNPEKYRGQSRISFVIRAERIYEYEG